MVRLLFEGIVYLLGQAEFISSFIILTFIVILLSKSIKRHARSYYWFFGIISFLILLQFLNGLFHISPVNLYRIPVLGKILASNIHMVGFGFPLLAIIMYVGALNPKRPWVKKILNIRKELSIISGFPILSHSLIRITYNFTDALKFFSDKDAYMAQNEWAKSEMGISFSNAGYLLGIVLFVLFMILWITSFDSIHQKLGKHKWKRIQRWSYLLYALLFVHSILLHIGWMMSRSMGEDGNEHIVQGIIAIASTVLVFGSYLILRIRKAQKDSRKKARVLLHS
ncbi:MAG TPA: hypothetical protein DDZ96_04910 [Porphyromonadaceae bacterium]|jgi:DMSO/TMAO reductase YedYZ heme-binding membrane subunit|nr:hypothetical protein [Porphyromonadaceae bacterium]HBL33145.1 hypothetical protein [Porphyromonadaceae bacterium]HBX21112.1 hypothetical protein [Porphyromonadaceae bacterium]HCM22350.1 hypothetical protein [Porphyromonadaceae bacterium]